MTNNISESCLVRSVVPPSSAFFLQDAFRIYLDAVEEEQVCDGNYVIKQFCGARAHRTKCAREKFLRLDRRYNLRRSVQAIAPEYPAGGRDHARTGGGVRQNNTSD